MLRRASAAASGRSGPLRWAAGLQISSLHFGPAFGPAGVSISRARLGPALWTSCLWVYVAHWLGAASQVRHGLGRLPGWLAGCLAGRLSGVAGTAGMAGGGHLRYFRGASQNQGPRSSGI